MYEQSSTHHVETTDRPAAVLHAPVAAERVVEPAVVYEPAHDYVHSSSMFRISPAGIVAGLGGIVLIIMGAIALLRGDFDGSITDPVVSVAGFDHTPLLGLFSIGTGLLLLLSAVAASRGAMLFFGILIAIAGIVVMAEPDSLVKDFGVESSYGVFLLVVGAAVILAAGLLPMISERSRRVTRAA